MVGRFAVDDEHHAILTTCGPRVYASFTLPASPTPHNGASWVMQTACKLVMDLRDAGTRARCLVKDRDGKYPDLSTPFSPSGHPGRAQQCAHAAYELNHGAGVRVCRRELLDRSLIWDQAHLLRGLREFEHFHNDHRPHQGLGNA